MLKVLSANRLADGAVVFLDPHDRWVELLPEAEVFDGDAAVLAAIARAKTAEAANLVLDSGAIEVVRAGPAIAPAHLRDVIRAAGPTVRRDHGKQAPPAQRP